MNDLMDRKFAHQNRMELTRVQASVEQLAKDPERSAKQGKLSLQELMPVKARVQNFILQCQRSPSSKVFALSLLWNACCHCRGLQRIALRLSPSCELHSNMQQITYS